MLVLLPFVLLGVLEVSLRLGGYGYDPHLFKRLKIGGEDFFVQNEDFSCRFFPREIMRNPGPLRFHAHKKPGTFRIIILGESAAMGDPAESFGPSRYLEMLLREKHPGTEFEVINVAFTAINSHVILPIARECAAHEGDLWIIYMGNNEMVGPFGAATVFGAQAPPLPYVRLALAVQRLRTGQLLMDVARRVRGGGARSATWGGMAMFLGSQVAPDSPRKETVYRNFQKNLDDIIRAGAASGAKVLLNTVAVNLKDCPPFASMTNSVLSPADRAQFDQLCTKAAQSAAQKDFPKGTEFLEQAARLAPKSAELQFHWGECLLAQTNFAAARAHFQLACDDDTLPFRADSRINEAIRGERAKSSGKDLILFDAEAALAAGSETGVCGRETFYEHVHFDFDGRYRLGRAWAEQTEPLLPVNTNAWISQALCDQMLGLSAWNRAQVIHFMLERIQMPPLSSQSNNGLRKDALEGRMTQVRTQMTTENAPSTRKEFVRQVQQRPEDYFLHQEFAVFLELIGDIAAAALEWQRFRDLLPQDSLGYYQTGRLLIALQRFAEAEASLRTAVAIRPSRTDAWIELGNALALQKKYPEALATYSTALQREPRNPQILLRRGKVLGYLNRHAEAIESYRAAIQLNPADGLSHYELGLELLAARDMDAAGREFGEAARLTPDRVAARFNYGVWLMNQRHLPEAQREFEAVIRLEPGNVPAQKNLAALAAMRKQAE
jgi:tetratricopeptide (TPR) repeat protein